MRSFSAATAACFARRGPILAHVLLWISARNRTTGLAESIGLWTGEDHGEFPIGGAARTYHGAGSALAVDPIRRGTGLQVRTHRIAISQISPEAQLAIRGYDPRHAPVELHRALFDPETLELIDEPHVLYFGFIDRAVVTTPELGGRGEVSLEIASNARALTKGLSRYRSNATLTERAPADRFREYATRTDAVEVPWGS